MGCIAQRKKRKSIKIEKSKAKIEELKAKENVDNLTQAEKSKLQRLQFDMKQDLVEFAALQEEMSNLRTLQGEKRAEKTKKKEEIFGPGQSADKVDDDTYLAQLYGVVAENKTTENVVGFENM